MGFQWNNNKVYFIAEIGSNHNGDIELAKKMISLAKEAGASAVKFQTYKAENLIDKNVECLAHVKAAGYKTQQDRFKSLEFSQKKWRVLAEYAKSTEIDFISTAFDVDSVDILDKLVNVYKISSGDANNLHLIRYIVKKNKPIILSVGMMDETELDRVITEIPTKMLNLLHCVSLYPTPIEKINLKTIPYLKARYKCNVGYSDHSIGIFASEIAVAMGARIIEKHFTLDKNQAFGDHKLSADLDDMRELITKSEKICLSLGEYGKNISVEEKKMAKLMRRGLALTCEIKKGHVIKYEDLLPLRPENGISPLELDKVIGRVMKYDKKRYDFIEWEDLN